MVNSRLEMYSEQLDKKVAAIRRAPEAVKLVPMNPIRADGVYRRCVWCDNPIHEKNVKRYSMGKARCHSRRYCEKTLPREYIKVQPPELHRGNDGF